MTHCECTEDGYCNRYQREMGGRMREICAGINIDLGTAAAFREQWGREAHPVGKTSNSPTPLLLKTDQAPGDAVVMTAAIYSLHKAHPGKYITAVESLWPEVFEHNPDVWQGPWGGKILQDFVELRMHYPAIHRSNERGIHFMQGWCEFLGSVLGIDVPLLTNRPQLYFDEPAEQEDYWVICSGGKTDLTNKLWGHHNYQTVVDMLPEIAFIQVGHSRDNHPALANVLTWIGNTTLRELFNIVRRSRGVVCGVSLLMHVAAALKKPAIVIAGGREPVQWNAYPKQHYLHTVGMLPCSTPQGATGGACWRSRTVPLGDNGFLDRDTCERPVELTYARTPVATIPECMTLIHPEQVAKLVLRYNQQYACIL